MFLFIYLFIYFTKNGRNFLAQRAQSPSPQSSIAQVSRPPESKPPGVQIPSVQLSGVQEFKDLVV